ncbi:MAG: hypothetical protein KAR22_00295, partial [Gammaproteobacteria bacterium]|nr:hypothetical protein [Gammaproteobacteria bacterium]
MSEVGLIAVVFLTLRVLLIGGLLVILPRITRKGLLFGTYIGERSAGQPSARRILSDWYRGCVIAMVLSLLIGWGIALAGAPVVGNLTGTAVLLLGALVLYVRLHTRAQTLASPGAEEQAKRASASLVCSESKGAGLAKFALGICLVAAIAVYTSALLRYWNSDQAFVTSMLVPSVNLMFSPFLALLALLIAKAKRSIRGGSGSGSIEVQNAFRAANSRLCSGFALLNCAFLTYVSVEIMRVGLTEASLLTFGVLAAVVVLFPLISLIRIMKVYGQGGALVEHGSPEAPLTNGLADNVHWVWGLFFVDRDDPSIMVEKRFGLGYTFNYGNRTSILIITTELVLMLSLLTVGLFGSQGVAAKAVELPNTTAGRVAAAYFDAFNSGDDEVMHSFFENRFALEYLERHSSDQRTAYYQRMHGIFGVLTPLRSAFSLEHQLTVLVDAASTSDVVVMRFQLETEPPHRLAAVSYSGIDKANVADEYVEYVATRAASIDSALRASTIRSVAQALEEQYVYPELGRKMAARLLRNQAKGRYSDARTAGKLADILTKDALEVSKDKHIWIEAQNPMFQESSDPVNRPIAELRRENFHFRKVELLSGNIGYIRFDMIHDDEEALEIAA